MAVLNLDGAIAVVKAHRDHLARTHHGAQAWDAAGIRAMLITGDGSSGSILSAALLAAEDASCRLPSPAALVNHWPVNATSPAPTPRRTEVRCHEHGGPDNQCRELHGPGNPNLIAAARDAARRANQAARVTPRPTAVDHARLTDPDAVRAQIGDPE